MKTISKSVLIGHSRQEMYALVTDVSRYCEFLPWCDHARILEQTPTGVVAEIGIGLGGLHHSFTTRNTHTPGSRIEMQLVKGPFSHLHGCWDFHPLGDGSQRACKVELTLHYGFDNLVLAKLVGPLFDKIAATLVQSFVKRAHQVLVP